MTKETARGPAEQGVPGGPALHPKKNTLEIILQREFTNIVYRWYEYDRVGTLRITTMVRAADGDINNLVERIKEDFWERCSSETVMSPELRDTALSWTLLRQLGEIIAWHALAYRWTAERTRP